MAKSEGFHLSFPKALLQELTSPEAQGLWANALKEDGPGEGGDQSLMTGPSADEGDRGSPGHTLRCVEVVRGPRAGWLAHACPDPRLGQRSCPSHGRRAPEGLLMSCRERRPWAPKLEGKNVEGKPDLRCSVWIKGTDFAGVVWSQNLLVRAGVRRPLSVLTADGAELTQSVQRQGAELSA